MHRRWMLLAAMGAYTWRAGSGKYWGLRRGDAAVVIGIRRANLKDGDQLAWVDAAAWAADVSPAPPPPSGAAFFEERRQPTDVLVAEVEGAVVGYAHIGQSVPLPSHRHVLDLRGLAVASRFRGHGVGRQLLQASVQKARQQGARSSSLRVLATNVAARGLYDACGFAVEGVLREEFLLGGRYIDDVFMARQLNQ